MSMLVADLMNRLRGRMTCGETLLLLQQYLDGELSAADARRVAQHLESCTRCDSETDIYRRIKVSVAVAAAQPDPVVLARLEAFGQKVRNGEMGD